MSSAAGVTGSPAEPREPAPRAVVRTAALAAGFLIAQQVAGKATRDAFYLSQFPVTTLPIASLAGAVVSMAGVVAFARGMARRSPARILPVALGASASLLLLEWALSQVAPPAAAVALYLHLAVFGATLVSGFWSLLTECFDPHRAKRAMGAVGTGASIGAVAGGFVTWRVAPLVALPTMILGLAALSGLCLLAVSRLASASAAPSRPSPPAGAATDAPDASAWRLVRDVGYLRGLAALIALCAFSEALLDFVFNASAAARFGRGPALVGFFAGFQTVIGLTGLVVQAGVVRWSLGRLGLAGTLALHSGAVAAAGALATGFPRFASVVFLRGAEAVLRNSFFRSAYELLYTPLAPDRKRPTKALVDVGFDRAGTIAGSGVVLLLLQVTGEGIPIRLLVAVASAASLVMLVLCLRYQRAYVGALVDSLRSGLVRLDEDEVVDASTRRAVETAGLPSERPAASALPEPVSTTSDVLLRRAGDLRSGDTVRIRAALKGDGLAPALVALAVPLLARDDLFGDLLPLLRKAAPACTGQLVDALLDESLDPVIRRRIPRVLVAAPHRRTVDGLFAALSAERFDVRYRAAQALARLRQRRPELTVSAEAALAAARRELDAGRAADRTGPLLDYVFALFALVLEREPLDIALRAIRGRDEALRGTALEYLENVLPPGIRASLWPRLGVQRPVASGRSSLDMREELLRSSTRWRKVEGGMSTGPGR